MTKNTENGWMWWLRNIRQEIKRDLTDAEVKELLKQYMSGVNWNEAAKEFK